jgi:flavin-dependent thymidylate synthase
MEGKELSTYVDKAMYEAEGFDDLAMEAPQVFLLSATPDPLGAVAAMSMMYEGRVVRDLSVITDDERRHYYDECFKTTLKAPLEAIDFHFMVEGITRAHSHQEVRQRTAVFAQESMRFAVKESIAARPGPIIQSQRQAKLAWEDCVGHVWKTYKWMIANGIPAEEARGLLPHDTLTRMNHKVNLRNLMDELGKRLCTQAQYDWKLWAGAVREAIKKHIAFVPEPTSVRTARTTYDPVSGEPTGTRPDDAWGRSTGWQFRYIAESPLFVPICFNTGKCMFKAQMDRGCTIRERVEAGRFDEIAVEEWAADPRAGWVK